MCKIERRKASVEGVGNKMQEYVISEECAVFNMGRVKVIYRV
jgi:hypothetical protein